METGRTPIYHTENYYKNEYSLLKLLNDLKKKHYHGLRVKAFKSVKELNCNGDRDQNINILIITPSFEINGKTIDKYQPTSTLWDWGYWRTRYQFKGITRICTKYLRVPFDGHDLPSDTMVKLSSGLLFPKHIIDEFASHITWYPEDYAETCEESIQAKETHETPRILDYIEEHQYKSIIDNNRR